ncbi:hypothetical protein [Bdellovibrio sp. NC01]|uniref:hypothetical protein n=1 Tax=Bdellovibrio sp. NC01 TaxID=2220073 RepID=UPI00115A7285|nr:hypothetical protein [Bdellovibrio sp. NC01]QDK37569.1 hypothetical protein DOE51_08215 [Bdellovibrio sp. NC01]
MKKLVMFALFVICPLISFAGPEDHTPGAVYIANDTAVPYYLLELKFDTATLSPDHDSLTLEARYGNLFGQFPVTFTSRHNEDRLNFKAEKTLFNRWTATCGFAEKAVAYIAGEEAYGEVNPKYLEIVVVYTSAQNACAADSVQTKAITYRLNQ